MFITPFVFAGQPIVFVYQLIVFVYQPIILSNNFIRCEVSQRTPFFPVQSASYNHFSLKRFDTRTPMPRYAVLAPDTLPPCRGVCLQPSHHSSGGSRCHPLLVGVGVSSQP
ncbi:hypothetical protein MRO82_17930, partial [Dickeya dianthicola]|nr:hypothetical protein [Dickeya dianthicola]